MSSRRIWILALAALCLAAGLMYAGLLVSDAVYEKARGSRLDMWTISHGNRTLYNDAPFRTAGGLKDSPRLEMTTVLPAADNKSLGFVTIGYQVEAYAGGERVYTFGSADDSAEVWGVKTHLFALPDGRDGRELRLVFTTNDPAYTAVSQYCLLADAAEIIRVLAVTSGVRLAFAVFYMASGLLLFLLLAVLALYGKFDASMLALALIPLLVGLGIGLNLSIIAYFTGPAAVYWIISIINLILPIPTLLFIAAGTGDGDKRWLWTMAAVQGVFVLLYAVCHLLDINLYLLIWHLVLLAAVAAVMLATLVAEFRTGRGRPLVVAAVSAILLSSVIDGYRYFTTGSHDMMDTALIILALPVMVLMGGEVLSRTVQKEYDMINENLALRIRDKMLYKNYTHIEKYIEETKRIWHDIDKHMSAISQLVGQGRYDEVRTYIRQAGFSFRETKKLYLCGNTLLNAVLSDKVTEAESKGITLSVRGDLPDTLAIQSNDLCSLFVNILDNAIEACEKIPPGRRRTIDLLLKIKQGFVYFECRNDVPPTAGAAPNLDGPERDGRGYGLAIIRGIVEKYHGVFDIGTTADTFLIQGTVKNAAGGAYPPTANALHLTDGAAGGMRQGREHWPELPSWQEFQQELICKVMGDEKFRRNLMERPKAVLQQEMARVGVYEELPDDLEVSILEQPEHTLYIVVPGHGDGDMTDDDLHQVAGGVTDRPQKSFAAWWQNRTIQKDG